MSTEDKIKEIFSNLFRLEPQSISDSLTPEDVREWDSMQHLNLTLALEEEFDIRITPEDAMQMLTFGMVVSVVKQKLSAGTAGQSLGMGV